MLGMKTGLPFYIVGTSTYGATGGFLMPGFVMGVLAVRLAGRECLFSPPPSWSARVLSPDLTLMQVIGTPPHIVLFDHVGCAAAAFMGLKGIQYVARVATYLPLIPLVILILLAFSSIGGVGKFDPAQVGVVPGEWGRPDAIGVITMLLTYVIGFFATAGAAGVDFGMNNRDEKGRADGRFGWHRRSHHLRRGSCIDHRCRCIRFGQGDRRGFPESYPN